MPTKKYHQKTHSRKRRQLRRFYREQGGLCYYCGEGMIPPGRFKSEGGKRVPPRLCTTEHLDDKWSDERGKHPTEIRRVAACHECNAGRNSRRIAEQPIEVLRARSGHTK